LKDCNDALALAPGEPEILDSRGLVHLRLGQYPQSIEDYDGSLRLAPDRPPSLFGRGLARLNSGKTDEGRVDLAAARAADPRIDAQFARYGVRAPPGEYPKATR
jgi:tetratricopeptide (TPR) repeat protein